MANVEVKEFKIQIGKKEYTFRLDFKALIKFNNRFKDYKEIVKNEKGEIIINEKGEEESKVVGAMGIFNDFLQNKDIYGAIVKILSCACVEKDFTEDELAGKLSFDFKTMKLMDEITTALIDGVMGEKEIGTAQGKNE